MARLSKAQLAGNVVILPTAAARRINNHQFADQRRASFAARQASPFKSRYRHHQEREADRLAAELAAIEQTPALLIVSAMVRALDEAAVTKIMEQLAPGAVVKRLPNEQAVAAVKASRLNVGQHFDLLRALDRLRAEGR